MIFILAIFGIDPHTFAIAQQYAALGDPLLLVDYLPRCDSDSDLDVGESDNFFLVDYTRQFLEQRYRVSVLAFSIHTDIPFAIAIRITACAISERYRRELPDIDSMIRNSTRIAIVHEL